MLAVEDSKKLFGWDVKGVSFISTTPKCYWPAQTCNNFYALMILFWKLHNIAHTDHIWFTMPNIVNGTILSHTFHMDTKGGNWLCLNNFLRAHFPLSASQKGGIFRETPRGRRSSTVNTETWQSLLCQMANWQSLCQRYGQLRAG